MQGFCIDISHKVSCTSLLNEKSYDISCHLRLEVRWPLDLLDAPLVFVILLTSVPHLFEPSNESLD
ncbi:hypothetical protein D3C76_1041220 [compost metagenome]